MRTTLGAFTTTHRSGVRQRREWEDAERYAQALDDFTRAEPLPWTGFYIARARALAAFGRGEHGEVRVAELRRLRDEAVGIGLNSALPLIDEALAAR